MTFVSREEWGARAPRRVTRRHMDHRSTLHWNGPKVPEGPHSRCAGLVRGIQNFHMDAKGWNDIAYNFLVCSHGVIFEGRGINVTNGANGTNEGNFNSHAIMNMAGQGNDFSNEEKEAIRWAENHVSHKAPAAPGLVGHRDHKATECPGNERYLWVQTYGTGHSPAPKPPTLRYGSKGDAVIVLQTILRNKAGGGLEVTGYFNRQTEIKVRLLQKFFKLEVDGIVGKDTWEVLNFINNR